MGVRPTFGTCSDFAHVSVHKSMSSMFSDVYNTQITGGSFTQVNTNVTYIRGGKLELVWISHYISAV